MFETERLQEALIISGVIFKVLKGKDDDVPKGGRRREKEKNS